MTTRQLRSLLHRARLYLDAASPTNAHEILAPILLDPAVTIDDESLRLDLLALLLQSCNALGHAEHLDQFACELRHLCRGGTKGSPEGRFRAIEVLAQIHSSRGEYKTALECCRTVTPELLDHCSTQAVVGLYSAEIHALLRLGDFDGAEETIGRALERAERDGDAVLEGNVRGLMATALKMRGRLHEALRLYIQAAGLHRRGGDYAGVVRDQLNRGSLLNRLGLPQDGKEAFNEAHRRAVEIGHALLTLRSSIGLGMVSVRLGELTEARRILLTAWREARRQGQRREQGLALEFLGESLALNNRPAAARRALSLCRRLADRISPEGDLAAECSIREALLALTTQDWVRAESHARAAIVLSSRRGMPWEEAQGRRLLGISLALQGKRQPARAAFTQSLQLLTRMGEQLELRLVRQWLKRLSGTKGRGSVSSDSELAGPSQWPPIHPSGLPLDDRQVVNPDDAPQQVAEPEILPNEGSRPAGPGSSSTASDPIWQHLGMVTRSARLQQVLEEARDLALAGDAVLILGETGTGKDLVARGIHQLSGRKGQFVPFNCAACPVELVESELFGVERGAFTGADRRRAGLAVRAVGGTLFLDEIGDLPPRAQGAVLRFLDQGEVRALGSHVIQNVAVGVVAATHHPLSQRVSEGRFRRDLYYRVAQGVLQLPPLRERPEDLEPLVNKLWARLTRGETPPAWLMQDATLQVLRDHPWPGNVRELEHFLRKIRLNAERELSLEQILLELRSSRDTMGGSEALGPSRIASALRASRGNRREAAAILGISRAKLYRLLGSRPEPSRSGPPSGPDLS